MARWNRLVEATPEDVWSVLSDGRSYSRFVVGTHDTWEEDGEWPAPGAELGYVLKIGPKSYRGRTTSRICEPGRRLELEAKTDLGTARIAFRLVPWGRDTLVVVDEHPLRGPAARWHNTAVDVLTRWRHRSMLARLEQVTVARAREAGRGRGGRS